MTTPDLHDLPGLPDLHDLAELAEQVGRRAAGLLLDGLDRERTSVSTKSSGTDMVTEIDRASEQLIVDALLAARPDDGILGEEGASRPGTSGIRWVIDPLDGTTNYLYRFPAWCVSVALEDDDGGLVGVVHNPVSGETFRASRGGGAELNGAPIRVRDTGDLGRALVATGFGYDPDVRRGQAEVLLRLLPHVRDVRRAGAAALDLCHVAAEARIGTPSRVAPRPRAAENTSRRTTSTTTPTAASPSTSAPIDTLKPGKP